MFKTALFALASLVCAVTAKTSNWSPQYSVMAIDTKWKLFLFGTAFADDQSFLKQLNPVKDSLYAQFASGEADLTNVVGEMVKFINTIDAQSPGFAAQVPGFYSKNKLQIESIADPSPEESWDFLYYAFTTVAKEADTDSINSELKALNDEFEPLFRKGGDVDTKGMVEKINAFNRNSNKVYAKWEEFYLEIVSREVDKYQANLERVGRGEKPITDSPTMAPASDAGSAASTQAPSAASGSTSTTEKPSASTEETTAPSVTPVPSATSVASHVVTVGASVFAAMIAYLTL